VGALALGLGGCGTVPKVAELAFSGYHVGLRERGKTDPIHSPKKPPILYIALDGIGRDTLYPLLRAGKMPNLEKLLSASGARFDHAYFSESMLSTLPSSTMAAWVTTLTGTNPGEHGVMGNEYFVRETEELACPAPVSFADAEPTLELYTDNYLDRLNDVPTVYERMRERDPYLQAWVALHPVHRGADHLLLGRRTALVTAFSTFVESAVESSLDDRSSRKLYAALDESILERLAEDIDKQSVVADVMTIYLSGADLYAHVADEGPDRARNAYLTEVLDPQLLLVYRALARRHALENRWVIVGADHGHTQVLHDEQHALSTQKDVDPPAVLERSGFRVRPFVRKTKEAFDAVFAYGGAMAYVYLADRSKCPAPARCDWKQPPRYEEDVLAAAEAFSSNDATGSLVPQVKGALDLVLVRRPKPYAEVDAPFEVYVGKGKTQSVPDYLRTHPHPTYVELDLRLRALAVGKHGERAGDILLLAHNGDRERVEDRYYFAPPYRSWHGSPSRRDSELPFIVARSTETTASIRGIVEPVLGKIPLQDKTTDVLLRLRLGR